MSIASVGSYTTQLLQTSQDRTGSVAVTAATATSGEARGKPAGASGFIRAIASALSELGTSSGTVANEARSATMPAQALGEFLATLIDTLGAQGDGAEPGAGAPPPPPPGGPGGPGGAKGPGGDGMKADLASLIARITSGASETATASAAQADSATTELESAFASLLDSLGFDDSKAGAKLGEFLQSLAGKLDASGPAGNLVNVTA